MRIITFNVNGLRAMVQKNKVGKKKADGEDSVLESLVKEHDPDVLCLQETKCPEGYDAGLPFAYYKVVGSKTRKGYSGVAVYSKKAPISVLEDFPHNEEGRVIVLEYDKFWLVNAYTPNSKPDLSRLKWRVETWEATMREYITGLMSRSKKPVVFTSDFNVAPTELDLHNPKANQKAHGFTVEERGAFADLLSECKLVDAWRHVHLQEQAYTWFSNFGKARENNKGWRIDHVLISQKLQKKITDAEILSDYFGSDHVPVMVDFKV
jgi:exodeoxyribonuclease-3